MGRRGITECAAGKWALLRGVASARKYANIFKVRQTTVARSLAKSFCDNKLL